jgi:hypothetical protein
MLLEETFAAHGHSFIRATHEKTIEVTKETRLTTQGDCIVAIGAEKGLRELSPEMRIAAKRPEAIISLSIRLGDRVFTTTGRGDPNLTWNHATDMVARMSSYTCPRTLMIHADKATIHVPRSLVQLLKDPKAIILVTVSIELLADRT